MKSHVEEARRRFLEGYNCSQAVFCAFADEVGLDESTAMKLSSSFGGGMGRLREVCGTVSAMFLVAGMLKGYDDTQDKSLKDKHYRLIQSLAERFASVHGSYICRDILKLRGKSDPISTPRTPDFYKTRPCLKCVETAVQIIDSEFFS